MKIYSLTRDLVVGAVVVAAVVVLVCWLIPSHTPDNYQTRSSRIKSIRNMVELCTADIHEEMAIKDSVNGKWIVARQTIEGHIRFDLDSMKIEERGDTTIVFLPPERVDILESTTPGSYDVLDSWDGSRTFFPRTLTAEEENIIKSRWQKKARERIYSRGYVDRARKNAVATLTPLLQQMQGPFGRQGPVIIVDPRE